MWSLSRRAHGVRINLYILAQDRMPILTVRTPKRQPQCAQPPHVSLASINPAADDLGGGRTTVDQHDAPSLAAAKDKLLRFWRANHNKHNGTSSLRSCISTRLLPLFANLFARAPYFGPPSKLS